jgi:hypothetical protein
VYTADSVPKEGIVKSIGDRGLCYTLITHAQPGDKP